MKKNIVVLGAGKWGKNHVKTLRKIGSLYGVCDSCQETLGNSLTNGEKAFSSIKDLAEDKSVEGVVIATPAQCHADNAIYLLGRGKNVLIEKPIALNEFDVVQIEKASRKSGLVVMSGHLLLFHSNIQHIVNQYWEGELGDILYAYSNRLNFGTVRKQEDVLWSFGTHDISILLMLAGEFPESLRCLKLSRDVSSSYLMFNKFTAHVSLSWIHPFKEHRFIVVGTKKTFRFESDSIYEYSHSIKGNDYLSLTKGKGRKLDSPFVPPLEAQDRQFTECVNGKNLPPVYRDIGYQTAKVMLALNKSYLKGGIEIPV